MGSHKFTRADSNQPQPDQIVKNDIPIKYDTLYLHQLV
jgi:hypothetical protein